MYFSLHCLEFLVGVVLCSFLDRIVAGLLGDVVSSSWARARSQDRVVPQDGLRILEL
ncbi:hypothetical protein M6B38_167680 [Iris pallida]|uniref:Uncharacterized protein n=1 Tax=Iris pallida TaxID=29817 RepID=A0AAX6EWB3_IRIPA|nr:hypothetical protein M6B38_167680 [Iris pallida]